MPVGLKRIGASRFSPARCFAPRHCRRTASDRLCMVRIVETRRSSRQLQ